jgi:hypothetical protein
MRALAFLAALLVAGPAWAGGSSSPGFNQGQIPGGTGTAPATGNIGEVLSSVVVCSATTGLTSGTIATIASISLTPGNWILYGTWAVDAASATTLEYILAALSTSSGGYGPGAGYPSYYGFYSGATGGGAVAGAPLVFPGITVSSTTTYYLNINASFSGGTAGPCGSIFAVRTS